MQGIYKYVIEGRIIYIGKSDSSVEQRIKAHSMENRFKPYKDAEIYVFQTANHTETTVWEKLLINKYSPKLNIIDKHDETLGIDFKEPEWTNYKEFKKKKLREKKTNQIKKSQNKQIKELCRKKSLLEFRLCNEMREMWLIKIYRQMLDKNKTEKVIAIPDKYRVKEFSQDKQFWVHSEILDGFRDIVLKDVKAFNIPLTARHRDDQFLAEYTGVGYTYRFSIDKYNTSEAEYRRILDGYMRYVRQEKKKLSKEIEDIIELINKISLV